MSRMSFDELRDLFMQALDKKDWNSVIQWSTEILQLNESLPWVWSNRGIALAKLGYSIDAILNYDQAIKYNDKIAIPYINKGAAYYDMRKFDEALKCYNQAFEIDSSLPQIYMNMGNVHKDKKHYRDAIKSYRKTIETDPTYAEGELALSMLLLKMGQLEEGWKRFECRWRSGQLPPRPLKCPVWAGEDLSHKNILVYGEQGLGDIIQFARYARVLAEKYPTARIIIEGRHAVKRLLETMLGSYAVINAGEDNPVTDYAISMMTLTGMFTPTVQSIVPSSNEFHLKLKDKLRWADKISNALPDGFRVGVCWAGMARNAIPDAAKIDSIRSTTLETFAPLCRVPGVVWISLQKGADLAKMKYNLPANMTIGDFTEDMYDFYETACAISACDLVITVDTAVAHVAASIGKETWLLSRWDGCWRWFDGRLDSPWYPTMRIFEQPAPNDWDNLMLKVEDELRARLTSSQAA